MSVDGAPSPPTLLNVASQTFPPAAAPCGSGRSGGGPTRRWRRWPRLWLRHRRSWRQRRLGRSAGTAFKPRAMLSACLEHHMVCHLFNTLLVNEPTSELNTLTTCKPLLVNEPTSELNHFDHVNTLTMCKPLLANEPTSELKTLTMCNTLLVNICWTLTMFETVWTSKASSCCWWTLHHHSRHSQRLAPAILSAAPSGLSRQLRVCACAGGRFRVLDEKANATKQQ